MADLYRKAFAENWIDAEVAKMVGIDLNSREFWDNSLAVIKNDIGRFTELAEKRLS